MQFKDSLSAVILNKEPTVEHLHQLGRALCVDPLALVFRPVLQSTLARWGLPLPDTEVVASRVEDLQAVEDEYNRAVLSLHPTTDDVTDLCIAIGLDSPSMVLRPALQGWLEQRGIRKADAAGMAQKVLNVQKTDVALLQSSARMDSLNQMCVALDMDAARDVLRPVLQHRLTAWGFSASESIEVAAYATQIGPYRQTQRIMTSVVLNDRGAVNDVLELGAIAGIDPLLVLLKPMVRHSASAWGASSSKAEALASEATLQDNLQKHQTLIAHAVLRSQPDLAAVERFLDAFGVTIDGGIQLDIAVALRESCDTASSPRKSSNENVDLPEAPKRAVKKSIRRKTRDTQSLEGASPEGEHGEDGVIKPKRSVKSKKSRKVRESQAEDRTPSPSRFADSPADKIPDEDSLGAD